jgi:hypothetical protein
MEGVGDEKWRNAHGPSNFRAGKKRAQKNHIDMQN